MRVALFIAGIGVLGAAAADVRSALPLVSGSHSLGPGAVQAERYRATLEAWRTSRDNAGLRVLLTELAARSGGQPP